MLMETQTPRFFCRGYYSTQMKNAEQSARGSLAHSAVKENWKDSNYSIYYLDEFL